MTTGRSAALGKGINKITNTGIAQKAECPCFFVVSIILIMSAQRLYKRSAQHFRYGKNVFVVFIFVNDIVHTLFCHEYPEAAYRCVFDGKPDIGILLFKGIVLHAAVDKSGSKCFRFTADLRFD